MAIEDALRRVAASGYRVTNLFQRHDSTWQANVRSADGKSHEWGEADNPESALHMAMSKCYKMELQWYWLMQNVIALNEQLERRG